MNKAPEAFRTISEVADELDLPQHVLRFWESRFPQIRPMKRGGGRRYYRPDDVELLRGIRHLLYGDGYTIRGVQRILREQGIRTVQSVGRGQNVELPAPVPEDAAELDAAEQDGRGALEFLPPMFAGMPKRADGVGQHAVETDEGGPESVMPAGPSGADDIASAAPAVPPEPQRFRIAPADLDRLEAALRELDACKRLIEQALDDER